MDNNQGLCGARQFLTVMARGAVLAGLVLLLVVLKLTFEAQRHFRQAEQALTEENREEALWHFQWALRSYVPGLPVNRRAVMQIEKLAKAWAAEGQADRAKEALRTLRATLYAIRSFYQPFPDILRRTEESLGLLSGPSGTSAVPPPKIDGVAKSRSGSLWRAFAHKTEINPLCISPGLGGEIRIPSPRLGRVRVGLTRMHRLPDSMHRPPAKSDLATLHQTFCRCVNLWGRNRFK